MIIYDSGEYHLAFILQKDGSTLPKAGMFALPSTFLALMLRWTWNHLGLTDSYYAPGSTLAWSITFAVLSMLIGFRCNKAYARFWDGCQLLQAMSAEWFESCSNLIAFSLVPMKQHPNDVSKAEAVKQFQFRLVHLMSLLHGVALRQVGGEDGEDIEVLDVFSLDDGSLDYLTHACSENEINRVEVILHWIQVLITESIYDGVLVVPPPILTRAYQTLSRGMVNLHNVRRIADIPFPFPLSQATIVLLLIHNLLTPILVSFFFQTFVWSALITFLPMFGCWTVIFICGEMEQPFGTDDNDLPLSMQQFEFHTSLMMLVDDRSMMVPELKSSAALNVEDLRERFGNEESNTSVLFPAEAEEKETMREVLRGNRSKLVRMSTREFEQGSNEGSPAASETSFPMGSGVSKLARLRGSTPGQRPKPATSVKMHRVSSKNSSTSSAQKELISQDGDKHKRQVSQGTPARQVSGELSSNHSGQTEGNFPQLPTGVSHHPTVTMSNGTPFADILCRMQAAEAALPEVLTPTPVPPQVPGRKVGISSPSTAHDKSRSKSHDPSGNAAISSARTAQPASHDKSPVSRSNSFPLPTISEERGPWPGSPTGSRSYAETAGGPLDGMELCERAPPLPPPAKPVSWTDTGASPTHGNSNGAASPGGAFSGQASTWQGYLAADGEIGGGTRTHQPNGDLVPSFEGVRVAEV